MLRFRMLLALLSLVAFLFVLQHAPLHVRAQDDTTFDVTTGSRTTDCAYSVTDQAFFLNGNEAPELTLYVGTTYTFVAHFSVHDFAIISEAGGTLVHLPKGEGNSVTFTPTEAGTLSYVCTISGHLCMGNSITVEPAETGGDSSTGEAMTSTGGETGGEEYSSSGEGGEYSSTGEGEEYSSTGEAGEYSSTGEAGEYSSTGEGEGEEYSSTGEGEGGEYSSTGGEGEEYSSSGEGGEYSSTGEAGEYSSTGEAGEYSSSGGAPTSEPSTLTGSSTGLAPVGTSSTGTVSVASSTGTSSGTFSLPASTTSFDIGTANRRTSCSQNSATTSGFTINGVVQPTLTLTVGVTYSFKADFTLHHFAIVADPSSDGKPAAEGTALALLVGSTGNVIQFTPTTVGTLYYVCTLSSHFCMGNTITVVAAPSGGSTGSSFPIPATQINEAASQFHVVYALVTSMLCALVAMLVQKKML